MANTTLKEYLMKVGDYATEETAEGFAAYTFIVMRILINKPGFMPEFPTIGIDINTRRHIILRGETRELDNLNNELNTQLKLVFPEYKVTTKVTLEKDDNGIEYVRIVVDETASGLIVTYDYTDMSNLTVDVKRKNFNN